MSFINSKLFKIFYWNSTFDTVEVFYNWYFHIPFRNPFYPKFEILALSLLTALKIKQKYMSQSKVRYLLKT